MLAKRAVRGRPRTENSSYWMSFSDMMSSLLMMFVLLLFLSLNRYMSLQSTKEAELATKQAQLAQQEEQLALANAALDQREQELTTLRIVLNNQQTQMDEQQLELLDKTNALATNKTELEQSLAQLILQQQQIADQEALLAMSQQEIDDARAQLAAQAQDLSDREITLSQKDAELLLSSLRVTNLEALLNTQKTEMDAQAARIDELVGVRARIIEQLRDAFAKEGVSVIVDTQTGSIALDSTVFFDTDKAVLKGDGRAMLEQLLPIYVKTLLSAENAPYVAEILIEGHTDSDGSYEHNLDLSNRRAAAVAVYCTSTNFPGLTAQEKSQLRAMVASVGRSKTQLIYDAYGMEDKAASRRVEIKFRLKDEEMIQSLSRIFSEMGQ